MKKRINDIELYDKVTRKIWELLGSIPKVGSQVASAYAWKPMMFNYMLVGASGTILSWILYEGITRPLVSGFWGGTFIGMVFVTIIVFLWNFFWNRKWSLRVTSQLLKLSRKDLLTARSLIDYLLEQKKEHERI